MASLHAAHYHCVHCGSDQQLQIDHIVAIANGGSNDLSNLQTLCRLCNQRKKAKTTPQVAPNSVYKILGNAMQITYNTLGESPRAY